MRIILNYCLYKLLHEKLTFSERINVRFILRTCNIDEFIVYYFFHKFINKWPTIKKLSESKVEDVMDAWSGLGYYSRAKNIHKTAKIINKQHNNQIPDEYEELIKLPGIGPYTAGAILTIAFNKKASVM